MTNNNQDLVLGRIVDQDVDNDPQELLNAESIFIYDSMVFIDNIGNRQSKYDLEFYIQNLIEENDEYFWEEVFRKLILSYHLNALKVYLEKGFRFLEIDIKQESINLIRFIKIELIDKLEDNNITIEQISSIPNFVSKINKHPSLFGYFLTYTDAESFSNFISKIFQEKNDEII